MRISRIVSCTLVGLVLMVAAANAQSDVRIGKKSYLSTCGAVNIGSAYFITNAAADNECVSTGAPGLFKAACQCGWDGDSYQWASLAGGGDVDLSGYVLLAGDSDGQTIQGFVGLDQPRLVLNDGTATLRGVGSDSSYVRSSDSYAQLFSPDFENSLQVGDDGISILGLGGFGITLSSADGSVQIVSNLTAPTTAADPCTAGTFIPTTGFIYFCIAPDTWQRVAIGTWETP